MNNNYIFDWDGPIIDYIDRLPVVTNEQANKMMEKWGAELQRLCKGKKSIGS